MKKTNAKKIWYITFKGRFSPKNDKDKIFRVVVSMHKKTDTYWHYTKFSVDVRSKEREKDIKVQIV